MEKIESEIEKQARLARNAYIRKWRKENPEKVRETNRRYWAKVAERGEVNADNQND